MATLPLLTDAQGVQRFYARQLAHQALARIKRVTRSKTLRASLRVEVERGNYFVGVPHYWAVYYHDGRGRARPDGQWLIWYPNPNDDPRHQGNFPTKRSQIRSLKDVGVSWSEILADVRAKIAVMAKVSGTTPVAGKGQPFFRIGLRNFFGAGSTKRINLFRKIVKRTFPLLFRKDTRTIKFFV